MDRSDAQLVGTLVKLHSFKGRYVLVSENPLHDDIEDWESVFLEIEGLLVPFFIDHISVTSDTSAIVGFEDIDSTEKAREFLSYSVYQLKSIAGEQEEEQPDELSGYRVIDQQAGDIGTVKEILDYNQNLLLRVLKGKQEHLIPMTEEIIVKINPRKKEILIQAPEGLLDVND